MYFETAERILVSKAL